jgi:hypothetical protein
MVAVNAQSEWLDQVARAADLMALTAATGSNVLRSITAAVEADDPGHIETALKAAEMLADLADQLERVLRLAAIAVEG